MDELSQLSEALLDLTGNISSEDLKLIIGGGFGIYLRHKELLKEGNTRTLLKEWPQPRSTNDLDLFLKTELLADSSKLKPLAEAIQKLGYKPIESAKYYQFFKPGPKGGEAGSLKIDILTGPVEHLRKIGVKADSRRAHPKPEIELHAHPVDEALTLEDHLKSVVIESSGRKGEVFIPHPFSFIMMKLFALRDRKDDTEKDYGRHHALDIYTVVAMMTGREWEESTALSEKHKNNIKVEEAAGIVDGMFKDESSIGVIRLRESRYYKDGFQLAEFLKALKDLFKIV
ncbi:MAG: hypothetical protein WAX69_17155 [Victivallales bacterium]